MEQLEGILEKIVVEVFVDGKQEVQTDLLGVHDFLQVDLDLWNFPVIVDSLDDSIAVPAWEVIVGSVAAALPAILGYYLFCLVIDVEDGGLQGGSFVVAECVEDWNVSDSVEIDELIIVGKSVRAQWEIKFGFPQNSFIVSYIWVEDVVIVDDSSFVFTFILITFIGGGANEVLVLFGFPNASDVDLQVVDSVLISKCVEGFDSIEASLGFFSQIEIVEVNFLLVFIRKPNDFGVVVAFVYDVVVCPLVFFGHVHRHRLAIFL